MRIEAPAGRLPLPPGWIDEPLLPEPVRFNAGRRSARVRVEVTFGRRGRRMLPPPALVLRDPFGLAQRVVTGGEPDELLVLPRMFPVTRDRRGRGQRARARARRADRRRRDRDRRPAPAPRGRARLAHPLAGLRARRRADGAQADLRGRLAAADRARPARAGVARGARRRRPRRRLADRPLRQARRLRRCCCPATAARTSIERDLLAWPQAHVRLALVDEHAGPALSAAQNRRGLIALRRRAHGRPRPARARPHPRRVPARDPRRAAQPPGGDRGRRLPGLRRRAHRQRGADGGGERG